MSREGSISENGSLNEVVPSEIDFLQELSDAELIKTVDELETEVNHLQLENQVFVNFLLKNDPTSITGMAQILEVAGKMQSQTQSTLTPPPERRSTDESLRTSSRKTESIVRFATTTSTVEKGPRSVTTHKCSHIKANIY